MHPFERQLQIDWPPVRWRDVTVLAAVSGGADSVALLRGLVSLLQTHEDEGHGAPRSTAPGRLLAAHFHHGLRGAEADADCRFVVDLCARLGVQCVVGRADPGALFVREAGEGADPNSMTEGLAGRLPAPRASEETSRDARYQFLVATARQVGARYVAVAHTADDQAETVLHHIVRGTGLAGLGGMRRARELADGIALMRPLFNMRRADARAYLADLRQAFREDSSNSDSAYTRNRLRNELLPALAADYNPHIVEALLRLGALAGAAQELIAAQAAELTERSLTKREPGRLSFHAAPLVNASRHLVQELLIAAWREQGWPLGAMGRREWSDLAEMATSAAPRKRAFPGEIIAERTADELVLTRGSAR